MSGNFLIIPSILICIFSFSILAQEKSDREKSDLVGFVKSVSTETAEIIVKNGKPTEKKHELDSMETFDIFGKQLTYYAYTGERKVLYGDTNFYDKNGKLIERKIEHSPFTYLCDKKTFNYDENGRLIEELCHLNNKGIIGKTAYRYNPNGKQTEAERIPIKDAQGYFNKNSLIRYDYNEKGELSKTSEFEKVNNEWREINSGFGEHTRLYFSNPQSRTSTQLTFDKDNKLLITQISLDDEKGNEIETFQYLPDGSIKSGNRYEYQFDKQGNIIKETNYEWTTEDGKSFFQPSEVTYHRIAYFSLKEIKDFEAKKPPVKTQADHVSQNNDKEEYAVYQTLLQKWLKNAQIKIVVVKRFTSARTVGDEQPLSPKSISFQQNENSSGNQLIVNDYNEKNYRRSSQLLENLFELKSKIVLVNDSEIKELFAEGCEEGWGKFYQKYPNSQGITTLSRVGFNQEKNRAIVYIGTQSHCLAGIGNLVDLQKDQSGNWKIVKQINLWVS